MPHEHVIAAATHGRFLTDPPEGAGPFPVLMGFHGYAESAATHLPSLARLDPGHEWLRVSVQGLHRFYARGGVEVVASWMTREDRTLAIRDNVAYAVAVHAAVRREHPARSPMVIVGFSQGVAQAYRTALAVGPACAGVVALGGDLPPDVAGRARDLPPVLIGRGSHDPWYGAEALAADVATLRSAGAAWSVCEFDGGHEWAEVFVTAAAQWIAQRQAAPV
jgi:predicted esterase